MSTTDVNDFLLSGGEASLKYETPGTSHTGTIITAEMQQQREIDTGKPKFWEDGNPQMQIKVRLQTAYRDPDIEDDDGIRADYLRGNKLNAVKAALKRAKAKLEPGGVLAITYTGDGEQKNRGFNPPKLYTAAYTPAGDAAVADVLGTAPAAPVAPAAEPAVAPAKLPPGITAEEWAALPQAAKEGLAKVHNLPPY